MDSKKPFYITTTLPYVNSAPHLGFATEIVRADVIARYKDLQGFDVFFNTGTDEHGQKIFEAAEKEGIEPQVFANQASDKFKSLLEILSIWPKVNFIKTTDGGHIKAAQEFWRQCKERGWITKKNYTVKYCVGCELEKTDSELENGHCPLHPNREIELISEENYFFRFSSFQEQLLNFYKDNPDFVVPKERFHEIDAFVSRGLEDFSISRLKSKMSWGIAVPDDSDHVMYVWFDALVNYIAAIGWPDDIPRFKKYWEESGGVVQYCGKDNLRQQAAMFQAMLMSVGLKPSRHIVIDGFILGEGGKKMSKSIGNVVDPVALVDEYGVDAVRYYILRELHPFEDSEFTLEKFRDAYNANLANGLGNLVSRIMKLAESYLVEPVRKPNIEGTYPQELENYFDQFNFNLALDHIWGGIQALDQRLNIEEPFKIVKENKIKGEEIIRALVEGLYVIAYELEPFLPNTSTDIKSAILSNKKPKNLFPRKP